MKLEIENVLDNIQAIVYSIKVDENLNYELVYCNSQFEKTLGYKAQEFFNNKELLKNKIHPDDWNEFITNQNLIFENKEICKSIFRIKPKNSDSYLWIENKITPEFENGKISEFVGIASDITKFKNVDNIIKFDEDKLLDIYDNVPEILFHLAVEHKNDSLNFRFVEVNSSFYEATGLIVSQVLGKNVKEVIPQPSLDVVLTKYEESINTKSKVIWEEVSEYPSGIKYAEVQIKPYFNENNICTSILGIAFDRTKQKLIEIENTKLLNQLEEAQSISKIGSWELDLIKNELMWSKENYNIFEINPNKFVASYEAFLDLVHPEDRDFVNKAYINSVANKTPYNIEHRLLFPDGRIKYINEICETFYDELDKPIRSIGTTQDITKNKSILLNNELLQQQLEEAQSITKIGSWEYNIITEELIWSKETYILFEINQTEFSPSYDAFLALVHPEDRELVNNAFYESLKNKTSYNITQRLLYNDGRIKYIDGICEHFYNGNGDPIRSVGTNQDVTEQYLLKKELEETENKYTNLFETSPIGIFKSNRDGKILNVNSSFIKILGYESVDEILKLNMNDIYFEKEKRETVIKEHISKGFAEDIEVQFQRKDGLPIWVMMNGKIEYINNLPHEFNGFIIDITKRKNAEKEQKKLLSLVENSTDIIAISSLNGNLEYLNTYGKEILELQPHEVRSKNITFLFNNDHLIQFKNEMLTSIIQQGMWKGELHFTTYKSKNEIPIEMNAFLIRDMISNIPTSIAFICKNIINRVLRQNIIKESEHNLENIFEFAPIALVITSINDGIVIKANTKCLKMFEIERDEYYGKQTLIFYTSENDRQLLINKVLGGETVVNYELELQTFKKQKFTTLISIKKILIYNEEMLISSFIDISTLKKVESQLRENEAKFKGFLNSTPDAMIVVNKEGKIILANTQVTKMLGYTENELLYSSIEMLIPQRYHQNHSGNMNSFFASPKLREMGVGLELYAKLKNGYEIPVEISLNHFKIDEETVVICALRDITGRKYADKKMLEQAELLDKAKDAILTLSLNDEISFWNKGAEKIYGWKREESIGKNQLELLCHNTCFDIHEVAKQHTLNTGVWVGEIVHESKNGKEIVIESHWSLVKDIEGNPISFLVINTNVTEKKQLEKQMLRSQRIDSIGTLAGGIAHDLNNILSPIMMSIDLLQRKYNDEDGNKILEIISSGAKRASDLVKQVLSFARGVEGERTMTQLKHLVNEVEKIVKETFPKSITINTKVAKNLWSISADSTQIQQTLLNLCVNARDAMVNGGKITIEVENIYLDEQFTKVHQDVNTGPYIVLSVIDNGSGMPPEVIERIFEPFYTTKEFGKGTGLGLATVNSIVKSHGGVINVYSEIGKGTSFRVYLPAEESEQVLLERPKELLPYGNGELILVVDDESSILQITQSTLEIFGYQVLTTLKTVKR
ncbi:MAG: PAS domain S-box protein [Candidatus Kapabacteria bacterium]|nr:PAS domain S-box protein [Candidatus Kapabacteria bacterium]